MKEKNRLTAVLVGQAGCGKSTLLGHLLYKLGHVDPVLLEKIELEAAGNKKRSSKFAWVIDKEPEEWERGATMECKLQRLDTEKHVMSLVDVPGNPMYQQAIVSGLSAVDAIVLVVDAVEGSFEKGMRKDGQTREHALLAYVLGVKHVIVAITKLDAIAVPYSKKRFEECKAEVARYMKRVGFVPERIACVPISGLKGDNLVDNSSNTPWYKGPGLLQALDALEAPKRPTDKPLRVALYDVLSVDGQQICMGRVECGVLKPGMNITITPGGLTTDVKSLEVHQSLVSAAIPGDVVGFTVAASNLQGIGAGFIVSETKNEPAQVASSFIAQVILMNAPLHVMPGFEFHLDICTAHVRCRFESFLQKIDRRSGKVMEENPKVMKAGDVMFCKIRPLQALSVEPFSDFATLGRFCVRHEGQFLAVGLVKSVECEPCVLVR